MKNSVKKALGVFVGLCILCIPMAGWAQSGNVLKIGIVGPLTTGAAMMCLPGYQAMQLQVKKINGAGGWEIGGKKYQVELIAYDSKMDPKEAIPATKRLINRDKVNAIIGATGNAESLAVAPIANEAKIPQMTYISPTELLLTPQHPYTLRATDTAKLESWAVCWLMAQHLKAKTIMVFGRNIEYVREHGKYAKENAARYGSKMLGEAIYPVDSLDFTPQMNEINNLNPEAIYACVYIMDQCIQSAKAFVEKGVKAKIVGSDMWCDADFHKASSAHLKQLAAKDQLYAYIGMPIEAINPNGPNKWFFDEYKAMFKEPPTGVSLQGYDALMLFLNGFKAAGTTDSQKVVEALKTKVAVDGLQYKGQKFDARGQLNVAETLVKINPDLTFTTLGKFGFEDIPK